MRKLIKLILINVERINLNKLIINYFKYIYIDKIEVKKLNHIVLNILKHKDIFL